MAKPGDLERHMLRGDVFRRQREKHALVLVAQRNLHRVDRLIELLDKRNRTIEECSRYDLASLDQLTSRLAQVRTRQEAELDHLASMSFDVSYEEMARMQVQTGLDAETQPSSPAPFATAQIER